MADTKKPEKAEQPAEKPRLQEAAASHDGAVQQLLARRDIASQVKDKDAVAAITAELAELGYE